MPRIITGDAHEFVFVDIRIVVGDIYSNFRFLTLLTESPVSHVSNVRMASRLFPYCIHSAVADGPNHSPGYLPQHSAPCLTNRCIENGAPGKSANRDNSRLSFSVSVPRRQSEWVLASNFWLAWFSRRGGNG